jgi:hypothetical protein
MPQPWIPQPYGSNYAAAIQRTWRLGAHQRRLSGRRADPPPPHLRRRGPLAPVGLVVAAGGHALGRIDPRRPRRARRDLTHWLAWGNDADARSLADGQAAPVEGRNDFRTTGYRGPCPPGGRGPHRHVFRQTGSAAAAVASRRTRASPLAPGSRPPWTTSDREPEVVAALVVGRKRARCRGCHADRP